VVRDQSSVEGIFATQITAPAPSPVNLWGNAFCQLAPDRASAAGQLPSPARGRRCISIQEMVGKLRSQQLPAHDRGNQVRSDCELVSEMKFPEFRFQQDSGRFWVS
jgi:hypothetical protein